MRPITIHHRNALWRNSCDNLSNPALVPGSQAYDAFEKAAEAARDCLFDHPDAAERDRFVWEGPMMSALRNTRNLALVRSTFAALARLPHPRPLCLGLSSFQEEAIAQVWWDAAQLAGLECANHEAAQDIITAQRRKWSSLSQSLVEANLPRRGNFGSIWPQSLEKAMELSPETRIPAITYLLRLLEVAELDESIAFSTLTNSDTLALALLLRVRPDLGEAAHKAALQTGANQPSSGIDCAAIVERTATHHGRLSIHAWTWDPIALVSGQPQEALRRLRAALNLPNPRVARRAAQADRQRARGRMKGPLGGDPSYRPIQCPEM